MTTVSPAPPSMAVIRRALEEFNLPAYDDQVLQIQDYIKILLSWNDKINLTAIRNPVEILYRHFCESMFAGASVPIERGRLADVGTG
ncbi:MAG: class I SAM-dependent methyltransferase, partial [Acidobacteria bacterium Pan2503]|nr:class I SAM-dependent methyltransferase [Candidatus Acidoferrum panamensis]